VLGAVFAPERQEGVARGGLLSGAGAAQALGGDERHVVVAGQGLQRGMSLHRHRWCHVRSPSPPAPASAVTCVARLIRGELRIKFAPES
jgi:hypothetical protein